MAHSESSDTNRDIKLTIDGKELQVPAGTTILEAARKLGIRIPTLCWLEKISTTGACRVCAVEVEGIDRPMTACNTPVKEGIRVTTSSPELEKIRRKTMELMLVNHPLDCPVCDAAGECELQDACYSMGVSKQEYAADLERLPIRYDWSLLESDPNRCIVCEKCVKVCREITGTSAIETKSGGDRSLVDTVSGKPLDCDFCGNCIDACPTGTLISKPFKFAGRPWAFEVKDGICGFCSSGCHVEYHLQSGKVARVTSKDSNYNNGNLCINGRFGYGAYNSPERLTVPMIKGADGVQRPTDWDTALRTAVSATKDIMANYGPEAVAGIASPRATNEENFIFAKLMTQAIGTPNLDSEARLGYAQAQEIQARMTGVTGSTSTMDRIEQSGSIIVLGSDLKAESAGFAYRVIKAATKLDAKLLIASARPTSLDRFANCKLRYKAGSEGFVALGLSKAALALGRFNPENADSFEQFRQSVDSVSFTQIHQATGLSESEFIDAISMIKGPVSLLYGYEFIRSADAQAAVTGAIDLALLAGADIYPIDEKNNSQGMLDMGIAPQSGGKNLLQMIDAIEAGSIRAMYVMGSELLQIIPDRKRVEAALERLDLLVVLELFPTSTAQHADLLLPVVASSEKSGSFTTVDNRIQVFTAAATAPQDARPDHVILGDIYARLTGSAIPSLSAISLEIPRPEKKRLDRPSFSAFSPQAHATGSMTLLAVPFLRHNGSYTTWSANNLMVASEAYVYLSEIDGAKLGVVDGDKVSVASFGATITLPVKIQQNIAAGLAITPNHFHKAGLNLLTSKPAASFNVTITKG